MRVGVLGVGKTPHKIQHHQSLRGLAVESGRAAMADAGVEPSDIQGLFCANVGSVGLASENSLGLMVAHHLGAIVPSFESRVGPGWDQLGNRTTDEVTFGGGTKAAREISNRILVSARQLASTASRP